MRVWQDKQRGFIPATAEDDRASPAPGWTHKRSYLGEGWYSPTPHNFPLAVGPVSPNPPGEPPPLPPKSEWVGKRGFERREDAPALLRARSDPPTEYVWGWDPSANKEAPLGAWQLHRPSDYGAAGEPTWTWLPRPDTTYREEVESQGVPFHAFPDTSEGRRTMKVADWLWRNLGGDALFRTLRSGTYGI